MGAILKKAADGILKYRYALLILLLGVALMLIPTSDKTESQPEQTAESTQSVDVSAQLEQILGCIDGVGKVEVMLTVQTGPVTVYQYDSDGTVIVTDADRAQIGLIQRIEAESYRGAIIVCQGADSAQVRLNVIEAVSKVTGLGSDRITVLKMK